MNHTDTAGEPIQSPPPSANRRLIATLALLLACSGAIWFFTPRSPLPPAVTILSSDHSIPSPPMPLPDRWIPMTWGWLWKLRYALLGKAPAFDIETRLVFFDGPGEQLLQETLNGHPQLAASNGVSAWILPEKKLIALGHRVEPEYNSHVARMTLGQGVLARMSMTTTVAIEGTQVPVGETISSAIRKHRGSIELTGSFNSWEAVTNASTRSSDPNEVITLHTNLTLAAKMNIPPGKGVFLYDTNRADAHHSGIGVLIKVKVQ